MKINMNFLNNMLIFCCVALISYAGAQEIDDIQDIIQGIIQDIVNNVDIGEIVDIPGIGNQININKICEVVNKTERDDVCFKQLSIVCQNETFLLRMMDANSKFPYTGMLVKTRLDLGSYDECVNLDITRNNTRVLGSHCTAGLVIPTTLLNDSDFLEKAYKLSTCMPDGCTATDLLDLLNLSSLAPFYNDLLCSTKESYKTLGWDDCLVIAFFTLLLLTMAAATIYDLYFYYIDKDCPNVLYQAFSIFHNGKKLLKVSRGSSDQIQVIHGLRVISLLWIMAGHSFGLMSSFPGINIEFASEFERSRRSFYVTSAFLAVDTFFFISGFLLAYQYLKSKPTSLVNHLKRIPTLVIHRYVRLTPVAASAFFIITTVFIHMGSGPLFYQTTKVEQDHCLDHWWSYFLYIQNYVDYNEMCLAHTWYLSADWQLFLISPIVLIPVAMLVKTHFKWIMGQLLILNLIFTFIPFVLGLTFKEYVNVYATHDRLNDYFIGFMLGVYMREKISTKYRLSTRVTVILWLGAITVMNATTFFYKEVQRSADFNQDLSYYAYFVLLRSTWCLGLSWVIYACHNGYGGFINWLLTTPLVQVLSKLTFCMYILHVAPITYLNQIMRSPVHFSQLTAITDTIVSCMITILLSVFWTLALESPLITIEKHFLRSRA